MATRITNLVCNGEFDFDIENSPSAACWTLRNIAGFDISFTNSTAFFPGFSTSIMEQELDTIREGHIYEVTYTVLESFSRGATSYLEFSIGGNATQNVPLTVGTHTIEIIAGSDNNILKVEAKGPTPATAEMDDLIIYNITPEHYVITQRSSNPSEIPDTNTLIFEADGKTDINLGAFPTSSGTYEYFVTVISPQECTNETVGDSIEVSFDQFGIQEYPDFSPTDLFVEPSAGGKFIVWFRFIYSPTHIMPSHFIISYREVNPSVNFDWTVDGTLDYFQIAGKYMYQTITSFEHNSNIEWKVEAARYSTTDPSQREFILENNLTANAIADALSPDGDAKIKFTLLD